MSTQAHQAEARAPGRPRRAQLCSGRGLPSTFHSAHDDLALRGGQCLHGTQSPPRSLTPDRSVAVRCLPVAASPGLCPPAGPCLDSGVLGGCTQQAVSKCPIVFVTCGTAVGQACPRAAARLARGSWCGAGLTRRSAALELPGRSCPTAAQWREGTAALSSCVVTAGRFRASAACRPQPAAGAVRGSLFQACAKGSPSLLLPGCCLDGTLYSPRPQGAESTGCWSHQRRKAKRRLRISWWGRSTRCPWRPQRRGS